MTSAENESGGGAAVADTFQLGKLQLPSSALRLIGSKSIFNPRGYLWGWHSDIFENSLFNPGLLVDLDQAKESS
jgi:hypothetical protein